MFEKDKCQEGLLVQKMLPFELVNFNLFGNENERKKMKRTSEQCDSYLVIICEHFGKSLSIRFFNSCGNKTHF